MKERIMFSQKEESWCGVACIAEAIFRKMGRSPSQDEIAKVLGTTRELGTSHKQMLEGAIKLGLEAGIVVGVSLDNLQEYIDKGYTVIVNWMSGFNDESDGHYSILEDVKSYIITLNDPEFVGSLRTIKRSDFEKMWYDFEGERRIDKMALVVI